MRCPRCGARNPDDAAWCSQCYARLGDIAEEPSDEERAEEQDAVGPESHTAATTADEPAAPDEDEAGAAPDVVEGEPPPDGPPVRRGDVRRTADGTLEWRCGRCDTWNPLSEDRCGVCWGTFADTVRGHVEDEVAPRDPASILAASVVLPGLGHAMLGRTGQAVVRGGTYLLWLLGGVLLLVGGRGSGLTLPALPLLSGAAVLLVLTVHDVSVVQRGGGTELLSVRAFLWLVVAVLAGLLLAFIPAMFRIGAA
ncbi:MAG: hypothetical protein ACRDUY_09380 [Nitriliruptorales bacterium]